jgi:hypothetical protein
MLVIAATLKVRQEDGEFQGSWVVGGVAQVVVHFGREREREIKRSSRVATEGTSLVIFWNTKKMLKVAERKLRNRSH